jgi:hypothetical protein
MLDPSKATFDRSGGLMLNKPLGQVGGEGAIDLLDVDWDGSTGVLRSRDGSDAFTPEAGAANYESLFPHSDIRLLARRGETTLVPLSNLTGKELVASIAVAKNHLSFTRVGTPAASFTYIADASGTIKRYDGTNFTEPTATVDAVAGKAMPKGKFLATWADEGNRLVVMGTPANGGPNGAISSGSHVWFGNPGDAESYESTAFVQLNPGDGENIVGGCVWNGQVFVFKETKMFVFGGISADAEGKPIFNFRSVDLGTRLVAPPVFGGDICGAGGEGVYFVSDDGLWVTTGGEPALLSEDLEPLARTRALVGPALTTFGSMRWADARGLCYSNNAVYIGLSGASNLPIELLLKFDLRSLHWTVWKANLNAFCAWNEAGAGESGVHRIAIFFSSADATKKKIYFYTPFKTTDAVVTMEPRWQSGFYDVGDVDEKTLTDCKIWGSGEVDLKVAADFGALGATTTFKLGTAGVIAQRQKQKGQTATLLSHRFSGAGPWSVQRISRYLRETRVPGTQKK